MHSQRTRQHRRSDLLVGDLIIGPKRSRIPPPRSRKEAGALLHAILRPEESEEAASAWCDLLDRSRAAIASGMSSFDAVRLPGLRSAAERAAGAAEALAREAAEEPALAFARKCARHERETGDKIQELSFTGSDLAVQARRLGLRGWDDLLSLGRLLDGVGDASRARALADALSRVAPA